MNRNEILQSLYTLRAGLSYISQNKDEVAALKKQVEVVSDKIGNEKDLSYIHTDVKFKNAAKYPYRHAPEYSRAQQAITSREVVDELTHYEYKISVLENAPDCAKRYQSEKADGQSLKEFLEQEYSINGVFVALKAVAKYTYKPKYDLSKKFSARKAEKEDLREQKHSDKILKSVLKGSKRAFAPYVSVLENMQREVFLSDGYQVYLQYKSVLEVERYKIEKTPCYLQIKKRSEQLGSFEAVLNETNQTIKNKITESQNLFKVLYKRFNDMLPFSQWKNLDVAIYYVSEGYADTVKEALNLYLQQRQNDRLVKAISAMESNVTKVINQGVATLSGVMKSGFETLSGQLDEINRQQSLSNAYAKRLNSAVDLNNVLRAKANITSQRLVDDLDYFRSKMAGV